ncbi:HD domain-containing protein [Paenibacillus glucanolyticus]|uniref:HD domain-containing protein n=1 Tax=Paenibacillus TaxID=44249 RepID=UPI0003E25071|nr:MULTISPECIES: HD domain-containing protein [Paenibacillus]ANA82341.1 phosphohydrolase [Paenibacillus glucanolyticus]AVV58919.1 HD domain-containing protein [Paenibacillus glucanolyticus]ETT33762.1 metal dependent phosphohydrolase [Paenibacillus sp. FSL R5-808]MPY17114.1 HD domain-containing protein [Paenibacillus glucanolyticus]
MENLENQINFLIEIDKLKNIERKTKIISGSRLENDAEHSWHLAMMAIILHKQANHEIDLFKVIKMLLVHDLVEIDAGDTFAYDTKGQVAKYDREILAAKRLFGLLPEEQGNELMELWIEFENKETNEAKFASSLDRLQPLIHNYLNQGDTWRKYKITSEQVINRNSEISKGSESLWEYAKQIINKSVDQGILSK